MIRCERLDSGIHNLSTSPFPKQSHPADFPCPTPPHCCLGAHLPPMATASAPQPQVRSCCEPSDSPQWLNAEQGSGKSLPLWRELGQAPELSCLSQITHPAPHLSSAKDVVGGAGTASPSGAPQTLRPSSLETARCRGRGVGRTEEAAPGGHLPVQAPSSPASNPGLGRTSSDLSLERRLRSLLCVSHCHALCVGCADRLFLPL